MSFSVLVNTIADSLEASQIRRIVRERASTIEGVWNRSDTPLFLGGLLAFIAELDAIRRILEDSRCALIVRNDPASASSELVPEWAESVIAACPTIDEHRWENDGRPEQRQPVEAREVDRILRWPTAELSGRYIFGSLRLLQQFYEVLGVAPRLPLRPRAYAGAAAILECLRAGLPVIAVHLKNTAPGKHEESNADLKEWGPMFDASHNRVRFLLVGKDPIPAEIERIPGVSRTRSLGSDLVIDLALISLADGFMGMASGLSQMAIFGRKPYAIFKHPNHHSKEMNEELGEAVRFNFSAPTQGFWREAETTDQLGKRRDQILDAIAADCRLMEGR